MGLKNGPESIGRMGASPEVTYEDPRVIGFIPGNVGKGTFLVLPLRLGRTAVLPSLTSSNEAA